MTDTALIILESQWWNLDENPGGASVLDSFRCLERLRDDFKIYHATFSSGKSLEDALAGLVINERYDRHLVYIAAHGNHRTVGHMHLTNLLCILKGYATVANIEGVIIGSCFVGEHTQEFIRTVTGNTIVWIMAYKGAVDWLKSTHINVEVVNRMLDLDDTDVRDGSLIFEKYSAALECYDLDYQFFAQDKNGNPMSLRNSLSLIIQPKGVGNRPMEMRL